MYVDERERLLGNWTEITVGVWVQRQYDALLVGRQGSQGRERQPSVAARSICHTVGPTFFYPCVVEVWALEPLCDTHFPLSVILKSLTLTGQEFLEV